MVAQVVTLWVVTHSYKRILTLRKNILSPVAITFLAQLSYIKELIPHPASFNHEDESSLFLRNVVSSYKSTRYWNADIPTVKILRQRIKRRYNRAQLHCCHIVRV